MKRESPSRKGLEWLKEMMQPQRLRGGSESMAAWKSGKNFFIDTSLVGVDLVRTLV